VFGQHVEPQLWLNYIVYYVGFNTWSEPALLLNWYQLSKE